MPKYSKRGKPFQSGDDSRRNANGRKTDAELKLAREFCSPYTQTAVDVLVEIMTEGKSESARVIAANSILDRVFGKPQQQVDLGGNVNVNTFLGFLDGLSKSDK